MADPAQLAAAPGAGEEPEKALPVATGAESSDEAPEALEKWNMPRVNAYRFYVTLYSFIIMGMNDGAVGALIPYIGPYYDVSYTAISLIFLAPFVGYLLAALSNNLIHHKLGQVGVAVLGPLGRLMGYLPLAFHPPFPALPVLMLFPGFGNGIVDSAWNAWIGNMQRANELLGFLHGAYGLGATLGPLIATSMVTKGGLPWYSFYYLMIGLAALEAVLSISAFWGATGKVHREKHRPATADALRASTRRALRMPITWVVALFLLGYVGCEVCIGGYTVLFAQKVRHAEDFAAGMSVTGFWLGLTLGRVVLGFITERVGEKLAITAYLVLSITLELCYWLIPSFIVSAVAVGALGFFLGPLFPAAIVAATKLLPSDFHVSAIGFAAAIGGGGAAMLPFAVGAIAQVKGVEVLHPIVLATLLFISMMWWLLPGGLRRGGLERARDRKEGVGQEIRRGYQRVCRRVRAHGP